MLSGTVLSPCRLLPLRRDAFVCGHAMRMLCKKVLYRAVHVHALQAHRPQSMSPCARRSLVIANELLNTRVILLIHHTDCVSAPACSWVQLPRASRPKPWCSLPTCAARFQGTGRGVAGS